MSLITAFQNSRINDKLLDRREFRRAIDEERMRVDRTGSHFSLVVFECGKRGGEWRARQVSKACGERRRMIDRVGLLSSTEVGFLLPHTDVAGAHKLARDVTDGCAAAGDLAVPKIYSYPPPRRSMSPELRDEAVVSAIPSADDLLVEPLPAWKRIVDIVGASFGMIVALPVLVMAAIAIKLDSRGPILFTQVRAGLGGRPFKIYKFRTMTVGADALKHALRANSEQDGPAFKMKDDPRITRVGRYLRRTCIDELPQFWNVIKGDMSLVGPRPLPCDESQKCEVWQQRRLSVTPGLTCIWQVSGGMKVSFVEWMRMDIRYIRSRRPLHDLRLLFATVVAVILHRASH